MIIGILSDIHGNADALQAVLGDASARHVDRWLNLGETFYGPFDPLRTAEPLATIDVLTIQSNQDRQLYEALSTDAVSTPTIRHVQAELGGERIDALRKLPRCLSLEHDLLACHGSPQSDLHYLIEDVAVDGCFGEGPVLLASEVCVGACMRRQIWTTDTSG